jgi:hypothetical protein
VTPVFVEVEGALTTFVNPASLAADTGTSTLVDGFDAKDVVAAAGTANIGPTTATTAAPMLAATTGFRVSFLTNTRLSRRVESKPDRAKGEFGCRLASVWKIAELRGIDAAPEALVCLCDE